MTTRRDGFLLFNEAGQIMEPTSHLRIMRRADGSEVLQQLYVVPDSIATRRLAIHLKKSITTTNWEDIVKTDERGEVIGDKVCSWPDCGKDTNCVTGDVCGSYCRAPNSNKS